jgi:two-component system, chemotaxis family, CheB/CheR fusion protein
VPEHEPLRVWVAACATGEEAYSIAISVHEAFRKLDRKPRLRLFATDVHRGSIERAGAGIYDASALGEMDPDLRDRYFVRDPGGYRVAEHLRNSIVFAYHNVLRDAPFTKLDLVCCRNLMIYFNQQAQRKVLSLFHFGLRTGGVLFLGPSETPGFLAEEFGTVDRRWKIYRKRRELRLAPDLGPLRPFRPSSARSSSVEKQEDVLDRARAELLERFAPPSLVIGPDHALLHVSGGASRFLTHREGSPSLQILDMVAGELKYALAGALKRSREGSGGRVVRYEGVPFESEGASSRIAVSVSRLGGENDPILVVLEPMPESGQAANDALPIDSLTRERMEALEQELRYAKENLQATIEEMEASNEELQATNEELIASNEELQSANEELQSVNEELHTVNAEHQHKIVELQQLTNDIEHLFQATDVHTVFLDGELRIRKFTPKMAETFHLIESDEGRTIETFSHRLRHDALTDELRRVLQHGVRIEHEVEDQSGCNYLMRVLPYRPRERVEGVVLTLVDVSNVRRTERALAESKNELAAILENSPTPIYARDAAGKLLMASPSARTMLESAPAGLTEDEDRAMNRAEVVKTEQEFVIDGRARTFFCTNFPVRGHRGDVVLVAGVMIDITDRKADERKQIEALQQRDRFLAMLSHELRNPLAAISSAAHIISEESSEETSRAANVLLRQTEHMKDLLADLLDVNRITLDRLAMEKRAVELREVVDRSFETVDLAARQRQIELVRPNDLDGIVLVADPARLQQLVTNVLVNGVKFSDPGSKVELDVHRRGQRIAVRITDTGIGLDRDQLDKIFALFYQGEQDLGRSSGGLGVGLSLARTIAEAHGGTIAAHSSGSGKGATFEIELPLPTPAELARCEGVHETLKSAPTRALEVVIVDDQRDNREMLAMLVSLSGHRTIAVADGEEAVATILRVRPQLALVDIGLPGMDGYEVARRIRAQGAGPKLYLAALTGYGRDEDRKLSREAGFDEHVVKPLSRDELQRVLQNAAARATTAESETHASTSS